MTEIANFITEHPWLSVVVFCVLSYLCGFFAEFGRLRAKAWWDWGNE